MTNDQQAQVYDSATEKNQPDAQQDAAQAPLSASPHPTPTPTPRRPVLAAAYDAVAVGLAPEPITIASAANPSYQKHADRLYDLAATAQIEALRAYPIHGTNSYAKILRGWQTLLAAFVQAHLAAGITPEKKASTDALAA